MHQLEIQVMPKVLETFLNSLRIQVVICVRKCGFDKKVKQFRRFDHIEKCSSKDIHRRCYNFKAAKNIKIYEINSYRPFIIPVARFLTRKVCLLGILRMILKKFINN